MGVEIVQINDQNVVSVVAAVVVAVVVVVVVINKLKSPLGGELVYCPHLAGPCFHIIMYVCIQ